MKLKTNFYIITGGPGSGKTTLINELLQRKYICVPEAARNIIKEQTENQGDALPWKNIKKYSKLLLLYSIRDFMQFLYSEEIHFFDRGIPDTLGYETFMNFKHNQKLTNAVETYRYNPVVFILPPWKDIYETDEKRKEDFLTAVLTYKTMKATYENSGYQTVEVPKLSIQERADYIITHSKNSR